MTTNIIVVYRDYRSVFLPMKIKSLLSHISTKRLSYQQYALFFSVLALLVVPYLLPGPVNAATLTEASIRLDRMGAGVAANNTNAKILVVFKPASTATEAQIKIHFPTSSAFTVDSTASNITADDSSLPDYNGTTPTAAGVSSTATAVSGGDVTFTTSDLTPGTLYGFYITGGITNPSSSGSYSVTLTTQTSTPTDIDSQTVAVGIVSTDADQVTVTAAVDPTFTFDLGSNSIALGTLSSSSIASGQVTATVNTNANNGYVAWIRSAGDGTLASATTSDAISSTNTNNCVTVSTGSKGYVVNVSQTGGTNSGGSFTQPTEYDGCNTTNAGGVISTSYEQIGARSGVADGDTLTLKALVTISAITKAASDYTDTWEVIGAGEF